MNFQVDVTSHTAGIPFEPPAAAPASETLDVLRQLLEVQREQLSYQKAALQAHDMNARWRSYLTRWKQDFPSLSDACRKALPALERCYGQIIVDLTEHLNQEGDCALDNEFAVQEFLDRYGMRLAQLGTILNLVGSLAEAGGAGETA